MTCENSEIKIYTYDSVVIGTGCAGYNCAVRIKETGKKSVAVVTEGINMGTSRNTGSDKQTYYKLGLGGDSPDSVRTMASELFSAGAVDGDNALCEAALSARSFLNLCEKGVEFPVNRYGEYIGYKTDHDPHARATSAGPLTSKFMTEALEKHANKTGVEIFDGLLAIKILVKDNKTTGLLCLEEKSGSFVCFKTPNVVMATGGPAGVYADSVYPVCHTGTSSLAFLAGAKGQNLTEWQYGLASINPRWNVSGTYMQVLPRFVSVDEDGNETEFLSEYFSDAYEALSMVFLKGYQWPFDSKKVMNGSSVIDLLVYREKVLKNRRVFLDYTKNPFKIEKIEYEKLIPEAYEYLHKAKADFGTPIERLKKMNMPAVELYAGKGVDITKEYLEIALCAQHNNGGIAVDMWWQTSVKGLFAAGECAGTHGVSRPGGSALNAGQVGSLRAATFISETESEQIDDRAFYETLDAALAEENEFCKNALAHSDNVDKLIRAAQRRMSDSCGAIRQKAAMTEAKKCTEKAISELSAVLGVAEKSELFKAYKLKDILYTQLVLICSMIDYCDTVGKTRGSALYTDSNGELRSGLEELFRFTPDTETPSSEIQEMDLNGTSCKAHWRSVRPIPENDDFFELVWERYRKDKNVY